MLKIVITYYDPKTKNKGEWSKEYKGMTASTFFDAIYDFAEDERLGYYIIKMEARRDANKD